SYSPMAPPPGREIVVRLPHRCSEMSPTCTPFFTANKCVLVGFAPDLQPSRPCGNRPLTTPQHVSELPTYIHSFQSRRNLEPDLLPLGQVWVQHSGKQAEITRLKQSHV